MDQNQNGNTFGGFLTFLRQQRNMPIESLSSMLNLPVEVVLSWENGESLPNEMQFSALSNIFSIPIAALKEGRFPVGYASHGAPYSTAYGRPYYQDPSQKKKMTVGKWLAIFLPIGFLLFIGLVAFIVLFSINQVKETEQYEMAYEYLIQSEIFQTYEKEGTKVRLTSYESHSSSNGKTYRFKFSTKDHTYIIVVRNNGNGLYVSERECGYYSTLDTISPSQVIMLPA